MAEGVSGIERLLAGRRNAGRRTAVVTPRPCRAPHQTIADVGLIGGGQVPMPGEVSLAHHSVLCLDALPECKRHVLAVLRQPLEEEVVTIARILVEVMLMSHSTFLKAVLARAKG
jgi:magnesium chelatase family protein